VLWARLGKFRDLHMAGRYDELPERCHTCQDWMTGAAVREHPETTADNFVSAGALVR
jgi:hypothetical protein